VTTAEESYRTWASADYGRQAWLKTTTAGGTRPPERHLGLV